MSLIARQEKLVAQLQPIHRQRIDGYRSGAFGGLRSRHKYRHIQEMVAAGYSRREAVESAQQCDDVAALNAGHEAFAKTMGAAS